MTHDHDDPILSACQFYQTTQGREAMHKIFAKSSPHPPLIPLLRMKGSATLSRIFIP